VLRPGYRVPAVLGAASDLQEVVAGAAATDKKPPSLLRRAASFFG